jgi:hypothetical protein
MRFLARFSAIGERTRHLLKVGTRVPAELPKLRSGTLILKDQVVEFEGIDFSSVEPEKARADVLQKGEELLFVVGSDRLSCSFTTRALDEAIRLGSAHIGTVPISVSGSRFGKTEDHSIKASRPLR